MNTEVFFQHVLPHAGLKILAELVPIPGTDRTGWRYTTYQSLAAMAEAALQMDAKGRTVYHACNAYGDWYFDEKKKKNRLRTQENVVACRALYDDLDVGKDDSYANRKEAGAALKAFLLATGLPKPTVVFSGGGMHLYWPFTQDIPPETWNRLAQKKRQITDHFGLKIDTACDLDSARVLRPVGTTWRKAEDRPVVLKTEGILSDPVEFEAILNTYLAANQIKPPVIDADIPEWMRGEKGNLEDIVSFPPSHMDIIAGHCAQLRTFQETGGESEPLWYAVAGIAKFCIDGQTKWHEWSANHPNYEYAEAQEKLDNWTAGPTTCERFKSLNAGGCAGCPHTCKSPVQLGVTEADTVPPVVEVQVELPSDPAVPEVEVQFEKPMYWPDGYGYDDKIETIYTHKVNAEGVRKRVLVASPLYYFTESVCQEDGKSALVIEMVVRGKKRQFELESKYTGDERGLQMQLAAYRIITMDKKANLDYVQRQLAAIRQRADEVNTYGQFGWKHDNTAFLIGDKLITRDGANRVRTGRTIPLELFDAGAAKGSPQAWIDGVNEIYNRPNAEPFQLAICLAFGGVLGPFLPSAQWRGIPYALTSDVSGIGKSTACKIGLNIYGSADVTMVTDSTAKAMLARTSTMGNLPFLMDEVTKYVVEPKDMSDLLYALSNGKARIGLTSDGVERRNMPGWNVPVMLTGNRNILHHVTEHKLNPEASQMRVFEVDLDGYPRMTTMQQGHPDYNNLNGKHKMLTDALISNHYGQLGEDWLHWVMQNRTKVVAMLDTVRGKLSAVMHGGDASKERFYYDLATLMLVGGYFAKKLGYISFDLNNLRDWIVRHVARLRTTTEENLSTPEDLFSQLMADMNGKLLITNRFDGADRRSATTVEMDQGNVRGTVEGRVIRGNEEERARVYISIKAVTAWCAKNGVHYTKFKRDLMALNLVRLGTPGCNPSSGCVRVNVGKGVSGFEHLGRMNCLEFDAQEAQKRLASPAPVVNIHAEVAA